MQKALESRIEGAVKSGDSDIVAIDKAELASLHNKKDQAHIVISSGATKLLWCVMRSAASIHQRAV